MLTLMALPASRGLNPVMLQVQGEKRGLVEPRVQGEVSWPLLSVQPMGSRLWTMAAWMFFTVAGMRVWTFAFTNRDVFLSESAWTKK